MIQETEAQRDKARVAELEGVIADAMAAMDSGLYGDVRRILSKGKAVPLKAATCVIAKDAAG